MKHVVLLLFLLVICCNNSNKVNKDYADYHSAALKYCKDKGFNDRYYFLLDFSIHSGKNRFFVYDFKKGGITDQNLVTHGSCDVFESNLTKYNTAKFDVKTDSHCSMKGKYKIGRRDSSSWGIKIKYWLEGLEASNKSAVERVVVLHSWEAVANNEIFPDYSPLSWGCPAVSDDFMKKLDGKLKASDKPVLLWIIE
ncbi:MAG TPA: murein L,D-transpeptidase catalytic domain family protein [Flavobacterium sp.]|uniref:murein L,D-transpeptidase catalytic domain-containing protein n=1 Tax=Flavobacterium sp. TaxID=239 RepID=UPI002CC77D54|nr:murein L,D-transpeptidase catalytic domain family protein [Flavobacterium sp.]HSD14036.1 murein L,D-transpeptidase catalytic domain family protein [Flavobacterium sp.]